LQASGVGASRLLVRHHDLGGLGWGHFGVEHADREDGADAADELRDDVRRD
jgi:hypothetical protein